MGNGVRTANGKANRRVFGRLASFGAAAFAVALGLSAPRAEAANLLELNFWLSGPNYSGDVPACDEQSALNLIAQRFGETERRFWSSDLTITQFEHLSEIAFRPWGPEYLPRRYCRGTVYTSDAHKRPIYYAIVESGGFVGASWGVEWCIVGLDREYAFAPSCKMVQP
ncbi:MULTISPECIES: hypothetical protein [unclassified Xanthobacter]|uniref:hypothetical protein n=1 Tax=unclassified Xanthobacter TaxID=2623496 RepID=UPI001F349FFA|nr:MULTISPECIES: hypothetical protein [unclassified Xanthobacter]